MTIRQEAFTVKISLREAYKSMIAQFFWLSELPDKLLKI